MAFLLPKPRPHVFTKRDAKRERTNNQRSVWMSVSIRDRHQCRCCGRNDGLHHHHLVYRSRGGVETTENVALICAFCHALIHTRQLWIVGTNADRPLRFEIHEAAVVDIFGTKELPRHVSIVTDSRTAR